MTGKKRLHRDPLVHDMDEGRIRWTWTLDKNQKELKDTIRTQHNKDRTYRKATHKFMVKNWAYRTTLFAAMNYAYE